MATMKSAVKHAPSDSEVLKSDTRPIPTPADGQVLINVEACGLDRSELFTRRRHVLNVSFLRIPGVDAYDLSKSAPEL